ncbi:gas vesicle protein GvpO [Streptomyces sp. A3M-1-3]|uniref:gas vesicle protein GvpO n=1 Tax=Streptomyces sp. A3M-1-3 TaxID=2962044 RepID=UPI0035AB8EFC
MSRQECSSSHSAPPTVLGATVSEPHRRAPSAQGPQHAARDASQRLEGLIGHPVEGVSAVQRTEDGWCVVVDVLEVARIPDTTSDLGPLGTLLPRS